MKREKLSASKRFEIHHLESVQKSGLVSFLSMEVEPNYSIIQQRSLNPAFHKSLLPHLIHCVGPLLEKYNKLNSYYFENCIYYYESNNIGIAIDNGKGLRVASLSMMPDDTIIDIQKKIMKVSLDYDNESLSKEQLTSTSFTITDLSTFELSAVFPLINKNQSCILGLTRINDSYSLNLSFDHRILEGYYAASFMKDLKAELFDARVIINTQERESKSETKICYKCFKSIKEDQHMLGPGLLKVSTVNGPQHICRNCFMGY